MQILKLLRQLAVLSAVYGLGELVVGLTGVPAPGSVVGMGLMVLLLASGLVPVTWVEEAASLLLNRLTLLFLPALVGLAEFWPAVRSHFVALLVVVLVSTVAVLIGSATVVVAVGRRAGHVGS